MHAWKHVFVHVEARPHAPYALDKALAVAEAFGGRVTAFDAVSAEGLSPFVFTNVGADRVLELAAATRTYELREELARLGPRVPVGTTVVKGSSAEPLLRHARNDHADLILKAASAWDVEQGTSAGTATLRLLREARVPVWLCSPHRRRTNRVLTAVNLATAKRAAELVIRGGARVAALEGAELHVLCVAHEASRRVREHDSRMARGPVDPDDYEVQRILEELTKRSAPPPNGAHSVALQAIEKAIFDLEPDIVVLSRDGSDLTGLPGTHLVERLFCRVECSMLLLPPEQGTARTAQKPFERRYPAARTEQQAHAAGV